MTKNKTKNYIENEKIHQSNYIEIHNLIQKIFYKNKDKMLTKEFIQLLSYTYEKYMDCQKNIKK